MKKDTSKMYWEAEGEELQSQVAGTVLEVKAVEQLEESMRVRGQRQRPNMEEVQLRRSLMPRKG